MGVRRGIDCKKVGCRSLIDANLEGQVGVNKFEQYYIKTYKIPCTIAHIAHYKTRLGTLCKTITVLSIGQKESSMTKYKLQTIVVQKVGVANDIEK